MSKISLNILKIGLAVTFLWIGVMILQNPEAWGGYLKPWALELLPVPLNEAMIGTGIADIVIAILLLTKRLAWLAALAATIHLIIVLVTSGINEGTVRDIGLIAAAAAIFFETLPKNISEKLHRGEDVSSAG